MKRTRDEYLSKFKELKNSKMKQDGEGQHSHPGDALRNFFKSRMQNQSQSQSHGNDPSGSHDLQAQIQTKFRNKHEVMDYSWSLFKDNNEEIQSKIRKNEVIDDKSPKIIMNKWKKVFQNKEETPEGQQQPEIQLKLGVEDLMKRIEQSKRSPGLDMIEYAYKKLEAEECRTHNKLSSFEKNRLALQYLKLNEGISRRSRIQSDQKIYRKNSTGMKRLNSSSLNDIPEIKQLSLSFAGGHQQSTEYQQPQKREFNQNNRLKLLNIINDQYQEKQRTKQIENTPATELKNKFEKNAGQNVYENQTRNYLTMSQQKQQSNNSIQDYSHIKRPTLFENDKSNTSSPHVKSKTFSKVRNFSIYQSISRDKYPRLQTQKINNELDGLKFRCSSLLKSWENEYKQDLYQNQHKTSYNSQISIFPNDSLIEDSRTQKFPKRKYNSSMNQSVGFNLPKARIFYNADDPKIYKNDLFEISQFDDEMETQRKVEIIKEQLKKRKFNKRLQKSSSKRTLNGLTKNSLSRKTLNSSQVQDESQVVYEEKPLHQVFQLNLRNNSISDFEIIGKQQNNKLRENY